MKKIVYLATVFATSLLISCGGSSSNEQTSAPIVETTPTPAPAQEVVADLPASTDHPEGLKIYKMNCVACHQVNGKGIDSAFPPLAQSDFITNKKATISQVLHGASGEMVVNGKTYNGVMESFSMLSDQEISDLLNFVYNSWGNTPTEGAVTPEEVAALR